MKKKTYDINYIYCSEENSKNIDKILEKLFSKFLMEYDENGN